MTDPDTPIDLDPASPATVPADGLAFPFHAAPAPGELVEVAQGVHWLRMPLPFSLEHINLWVLEARDHYVLVDTGIASARSRELWEQLAAQRLADKPVRGLICTHMHPDHMGLAGWLCERFDVPLSMTRDEYLYGRVLCVDGGGTAPASAVRFYRAAGYDEAELERLRDGFGVFARVVEMPPSEFVRLQDGERLSLAGLDWQVMVGRGHSPEHACLYCRQQRVVIAGDQILPSISSNVSVWPTEPQANPLDEWLTSCAALRAALPEDTLVLPSHGLPFRGVHERLTALIDHHKASLDRLYRAARTPLRAVDTFEVLFSRPVRGEEKTIATGEALAHLRYLQRRGLLRVSRDDSGVDWYRQA